MACCLTTPSHYLNQCWLIITKVQWCSSISLEISQPSVSKISFKIIFLKSPRGQWVKTVWHRFVDCVKLFIINLLLTHQVCRWVNFVFANSISVVRFRFHKNRAVSCVESRTSLQWRHNERDGVSNHQPHDCLLNRLSRRSSKKTPKLRVTGIFCGEFTGDLGYPTVYGTKSWLCKTQNNAFIFVGNCFQGPLSLTWLNFNPSMDK